MNKKVISFAAAMMLAALPLAAGSAAGFTAGEYEASAQGFGGPVTVKVTVDADTVTAVEVTGEGEPRRSAARPSKATTPLWSA